MRILVTGSTGLIGTSLSARLKQDGHALNYLVRQIKREGDFLWNIEKSELDPNAFNGVDAVIHLAGESVVGLRWSAAKKRRILESRVKSTALLREALSKMPKKPQVFICASAIGIYGDRADELLNEESSAGVGFLSEVVQKWEAQTLRIRELGIRVVNLRFGVVLSPRGGALKSMLPPFLLGGGGRLGSGKQYMSWVSLEDVVGAAVYSLSDKNLNGPVNVVSPGAVTNAEFTKALAKAIHRPAYFHLPAWGLKLLLGQMAEEMLLFSTKVEPKKLLQAGFKFQDQEILAYLSRSVGAR